MGVFCNIVLLNKILYINKMFCNIYIFYIRYGGRGLINKI